MSFAEIYQRNRAHAAEFEGFFGDFSIAVLSNLLTAQEEAGVRGDLVEYGVYRGRSAAVLLAHLREGERAVLVDSSNAPQLDALARVSPAFEFVQGKSEDLVAKPGFGETVGRTVRLSHHDASHTYHNLTSELRFMEGRVVPGGIVVLDDFFNPNFLQVTAACFEYLASGRSDLEMLLYCSAKAYLCHRADFDRYARHVLERTLPEVQGLGFSCMLSRTDDHDRYRGFSLIPKGSPDQPDFYGTQFNGDRYYRL